MRNKLLISVVVLAVVLIAWSKFTDNHDKYKSTVDGMVSAEGIHWHPKLSISVHGESVLVPANTGLIGGHKPIHTHDEKDGTIHLEFDNLVRKSDITLGKFFQIWGKEFSSTQLFENHNSEMGQVRMTVNGEENTDFENYIFKDGDDIQLSFE